MTVLNIFIRILEYFRRLYQAQLGKVVFDDRKNYVEDVKDVDLYKMIPFNCELPGASQLHISLMDWDQSGKRLNRI